ncbi:TrmH family RNA methyltransferase [Granulibacter bethesdensis]|uniref:TrmH family RNA methyltransferase n=1 Tax=Granulibacter bethesdensis TaxID=364410 RepID=UPI0003F1C9F2|nr:23S rRNA Gm2251 methyltransferase [Granulibacter bethesdensis CGDNIH4]
MKPPSKHTGRGRPTKNASSGGFSRSGLSSSDQSGGARPSGGKSFRSREGATRSEQGGEYRSRSDKQHFEGNRPTREQRFAERGERPYQGGERPAGGKPSFRSHDGASRSGPHASERTERRPRFDAPREEQSFGERTERPTRHRQGGERPSGGRSFRPRDGANRSDEHAERRPRSDHSRSDTATQAQPAVERPSRSGGRALQAPVGAVWLHGLHAVEAALRNPARRLRRLLLTEEAEATLAERLPPPWALAPERTERAHMDQLLGTESVHQGIALLADKLPSPPLDEILTQRPGPVLVLDQVSDPRNVGAILRSAAAFQACCVIVQDRNAPEESGTMAKAASGALDRLPMLRVVNIARTLAALKAADLWVVGLDAEGAPLSGPALGKRRVALVMGAEGDGLRRLTRESCDEIVSLAMAEGMESLNVSVATAIALYEISRNG